PQGNPPSHSTSERRTNEEIVRKASTPVDRKPTMLPVPAPKKFSRYESSVTELNADRPPGYTQVLFGVNGMARPGHVLAVMGTSGSGKTTLLNVLADSQLKGTIVRGSVRVNGITLGSHIRDLSAYVKQHYMFDGTLSVKETLMFRAQDGASLPLKPNGLSIACEMLTNPAPCLLILACLNTTVVCAVHQPSSYVFALFDQILLLAEGRVVFMGTPQDCTNFF
ncbi:hypothetical protein BaRGS_00017810, partial [Batillaria attramentaria]